MGGHDEPFYLHAKHMYNLDRMKTQKLTMSLDVLTAFSIGVVVPIYALGVTCFRVTFLFIHLVLQ